MKKFLTLITLTSALIPTIHGSMSTNLPAHVRKQYDNLTTLVKNANIEAFKPAFDAISLPTEFIIESLRNTVAETKIAITRELETMGDTTKNWSKIIKGGLATFFSGWAGLAPFAIASLKTNSYPSFSEAPLVIAALPIIIPSALIVTSIETIKKPYFIQDPDRFCLVAINALACLGIAYKGLTYGLKTFEAGWNYKEHLQKMLTNLDEINEYIGTSYFAIPG